MYANTTVSLPLVGFLCLYLCMTFSMHLLFMALILHVCVCVCAHIFFETTVTINDNLPQISLVYECEFNKHFFVSKSHGMFN